MISGAVGLYVAKREAVCVEVGSVQVVAAVVVEGQGGILP